MRKQREKLALDRTTKNSFMIVILKKRYHSQKERSLAYPLAPAREHLAVPGDMFDGHSREGSFHVQLMGRGHRCWKTSRHAQGSYNNEVLSSSGFQQCQGGETLIYGKRRGK